MQIFIILQLFCTIALANGIIVFVSLKIREVMNSISRLENQLEIMQIKTGIRIDKIDAEVTCIANHYLLKDKGPE